MDIITDDGNILVLRSQGEKTGIYVFIFFSILGIGALGINVYHSDLFFPPGIVLSLLFICLGSFALITKRNILITVDKTKQEIDVSTASRISNIQNNQYKFTDVKELLVVLDINANVNLTKLILVLNNGEQRLLYTASSLGTPIKEYAQKIATMTNIPLRTSNNNPPFVSI